MKICGYCGRENAETAQTCHECGSRLTEEVFPPSKPFPWKALRRASWFAAFLFVVVLIYFLSFGPVTRYFTAVTRKQEIGESLHVTYRYPNWVYQFYYPAHWLSLTQWGHLTYGKYLRWWERPERTD
jgi:hypothetical protein